MLKVKFQTRIEWACCINALVEVHGDDEEGITAVYEMDHGTEIYDSLSDRQKDRLYEELQEHITDAFADEIDRTYDEMRDRKMLRLLELPQ